MANSGLETGRRLTALRLAKDAQTGLNATHSKWILNDATRPAARGLGPVSKDLADALRLLADSNADHWAAAPLLWSVAQALLNMASPELEQARHDAQLAYEEIAAQRA